MVVLGCLTRLTRSGLSITDWSIMGTLPPLSDQSWSEHFARYQQSPEYKLINSSMSLGDFKVIFWWEWTHRLIGRLTGLVFLAGFSYFTLTRKFSRALFLKSCLLLCIGALQGLIGWWMVKSGLIDNPHVNHFRLAIHLMAAFTAFAFSFWFALQLIFESEDDSKFYLYNTQLFSLAIATLALLLVQIIYGALVAGLKAGYYLPTWPKMGDRWFPHEAILTSNSLLIDFSENPVGVQFVHRTLAWVVVVFVLAVWGYSKNETRLNLRQKRSVNILVVLTLFQVALGIFTLLYSVPTLLGVLHQSVAFFLFANLIFLIFQLRRSRAT